MWPTWRPRGRRPTPHLIGLSHKEDSAGLDLDRQVEHLPLCDVRKGTVWDRSGTSIYLPGVEIWPNPVNSDLNRLSGSLQPTLACASATLYSSWASPRLLKVF